MYPAPNKANTHLTESVSEVTLSSALERIKTRDLSHSVLLGYTNSTTLKKSSCYLKAWPHLPLLKLPLPSLLGLAQASAWTLL